MEMPLSPSTEPKIAVLVIAAGLALGACASYRPAPLQPAAEEVLKAPDFAVLSREARSFSHPRLAPVNIDPNAPMTPQALAVLAVISSPDLKAARAKARVADAQVFAAGLLPDPTISLGFDHILSGPDTVTALTSQVAVDLVAFRDRGVTRARAEAQRSQVRLDLAWQEWQTAGQARLLAARIAGLEAVLRIDREMREMSEASLVRVLEAAGRGDVRGDDVAARRIAAADAADKTRAAERDLATARLDLNRLLGVRPETRIAIATEADELPQLDAEALFQQARQERLDLAALEAGYASQEAALRKAVMDQFPSLQLTITRARDTTGNQTLGPSINFTLPLWNRNRGAIATEAATREQLQAEYAARLMTTRADIAELVDAIETVRRQRAEVAAQAGPLARLAAATEAAAARGDVARAIAESARLGVSDKMLTLAALDQSLAEQSVALEIAVGGPFAGASDTPPQAPQ